MLIVKRSNFLGIDRANIEEYSKDVDKDIKNLTLLAQGKTSFGNGANGSTENIAGQFQTFTSNIAADTEDTVAHTLGIIPIGYIVTDISKGGVVYHDPGGTAWDSTDVYFKTTIASAVVTVFLLK